MRLKSGARAAQKNLAAEKAVQQESQQVESAVSTDQVEVEVENAAQAGNHRAL